VADRMVRVVWAKPRRRIGFGVALAGLFVAAALLTGVLSTGSPSAQTVGPNGPDPKLQAITGKVKVGPTFVTNGGGTNFTLYVLAGVAYKF